jgi:hypothetical protein
LPVSVPVGTSTPLVLYSGDQAANVPRTDGIFSFVERFDAPLPATTTFVPTQWVLNAWAPCNRNRPLDASPTPGAYCMLDNTAAATKHTLASPVAQGIVATGLPANQVYEMSFWTEGKMIVDANQQPDTNDLFYFSYLNANGPSYELTMLVPAADFVDYPPNVPSFTFVERNNQPRTVAGWNFGATGIPWTRARARFIPAYDHPSLTFRFVSNDAVANGGTLVAIDDLTVRLAANPELSVALGPVEMRH